MQIPDCPVISGKTSKEVRLEDKAPTDWYCGAEFDPIRINYLVNKRTKQIWMCKFSKVIIKESSTLLLAGGLTIIPFMKKCYEYSLPLDAEKTKTFRRLAEELPGLRIATFEELPETI